MDFVKRIFLTANATAIYGPQNPYAVHPELVQKFWDYEAGMTGVLADVLPWITSRKSWKAKRDINAALREYVEKGWYRNASPLIQKRVAINLKHGLDTINAGRSELIMLFGIVGNAVPTTFWLLSHIFSRPELLARIREETSRAVYPATARGNNAKSKIINMSKLKTHCPLLVSTYRETLRYVANLASVRMVTNTHTITAPSYPAYLLRKGSIVQIASGHIHASEAVWGKDAKRFNPERFISSSGTSAEQFESKDNTTTAYTERTTTALPKNVPSAAFRAFGGGSVICPGRHFAQTEILGFAALCVNMLDIVGRDDNAMELPERDDRSIPLSVMKPVVEPWVKIRRREGEEDVLWGLEL
jgi:cytochrome P450